MSKLHTLPAKATRSDGKVTPSASRASSGRSNTSLTSTPNRKGGQLAAFTSSHSASVICMPPALVPSTAPSVPVVAPTASLPPWLAPTASTPPATVGGAISSKVAMDSAAGSLPSPRASAAVRPFSSLRR
jgi:hypothetical protein